MQFLHHIYFIVCSRLILIGLSLTVSACTTADISELQENTETVKPLLSKKISSKTLATKNDHALHNIAHHKSSNILVTKLNTDDQYIGSNKISKIELKCSAQLQCIKLIQQKIINRWDYPKSYPKFKTILVLELNQEGYITTIRLRRSSGRRDFDDSVIKAVRQAAPFTEITYLSELALSEFSSLEMVFKR